jgi:hypothetical protein
VFFGIGPTIVRCLSMFPDLVGLGVGYELKYAHPLMCIRVNVDLKHDCARLSGKLPNDIDVSANVPRTLEVGP